MIYHRDVPLKSFLPEKLFLAKQGSTAPFPPLLAPCRCNLVFGANVSAEMNPEWIMDTGARLMEGSRFQIRGHRYFRVMFADIGIFIPIWIFCPVFFFIFNFIFFQEFGPESDDDRCRCTTRRLRKYLSCSRVIFFLEISCKHFQISRYLLNYKIYYK